MTEQVPRAFLQILSDLADWLEAVQAPAMIVGGVAASVLGRPRATRDIDALAILAEDQWADALATASKYGIVPRIGEPLDFAQRTRVLLLRHEKTGIDIDVILGRLPFEEEAIGQVAAERLTETRISHTVARHSRFARLLLTPCRRLVVERVKGGTVGRLRRRRLADAR